MIKFNEIIKNFIPFTNMMMFSENILTREKRIHLNFLRE